MWILPPSLDIARQGIGLCRTEHMFFASEERIATVRRMIVAQVGEKGTCISPCAYLCIHMCNGGQYFAGRANVCFTWRPRPLPPALTSCPARPCTFTLLSTQTREARLKALADLLPFQRADFEVGGWLAGGCVCALMALVAGHPWRPGRDGHTCCPPLPPSRPSPSPNVYYTFHAFPLQSLPLATSH